MLQSIIPPVVTPMLADESIDLPGLRAHIDFLLGKGSFVIRESAAALSRMTKDH